MSCFFLIWYRYSFFFPAQAILTGTHFMSSYFRSRQKRSPSKSSSSSSRRGTGAKKTASQGARRDLAAMYYGRTMQSLHWLGSYMIIFSVPLSPSLSKSNSNSLSLSLSLSLFLSLSLSPFLHKSLSLSLSLSFLWVYHQKVNEDLSVINSWTQYRFVCFNLNSNTPPRQNLFLLISNIPLGLSTSHWQRYPAPNY